jgi:hypothetical protein
VQVEAAEAACARSRQEEAELGAYIDKAVRPAYVQYCQPLLDRLCAPKGGLDVVELDSGDGTTTAQHTAEILKMFHQLSADPCSTALAWAWTWARMYKKRAFVIPVFIAFRQMLEKESSNNHSNITTRQCALQFGFDEACIVAISILKVHQTHAQLLTNSK